VNNANPRGVHSDAGQAHQHLHGTLLTVGRSCPSYLQLWPLASSKYLYTCFGSGVSARVRNLPRSSRFVRLSSEYAQYRPRLTR
jgi:hypothetical protein